MPCTIYNFAGALSIAQELVGCQGSGGRGYSHARRYWIYLLTPHHTERKRTSCGSRKDSSRGIYSLAGTKNEYIASGTLFAYCSAGNLSSGLPDVPTLTY